MVPIETARIFETRWGGRTIDQRAWSSVERCRKKLRLESVPLPVPVEDWIEGPLGIRFGVTDLSHLGPEVLGAAFVQDGEILIDPRALGHEGRYRFTCAHELGHFVLHKKVQSVFHETPETASPSLQNACEREADRFAAAFLMPLALLEREILRVFDEHGMNSLECTTELMQASTESEWLWRKRLLPTIMRRFAVSLSAAVIRCSNIQPRITHTRPLLPRELADRFLERARADSDIDHVRLVDGVPKKQDLFNQS